jgi:hypothetical protein
MKIKCSIFDKSIILDSAAEFSHQFISTKTGTRFVAATIQGNPVLTIKAAAAKSEKASIPAVREKIARVALQGQPWDVKVDPSSKAVLISIGGQRPKISISEQESPSLSGTESQFSFSGERPKIKLLQANRGTWHVHSDSAGKALNVSFDPEPCA